MMGGGRGGGGGVKGCLELLKTHLFWYHIHHPSLSSFWTVLLFGEFFGGTPKFFLAKSFSVKGEGGEKKNPLSSI